MPYRKHLSKDKNLKKLIVRHDGFTLRKRKNVCLRLCASIMSQQLSTKVAEVIYKRFLNLFDGKNPTPQQILSVKPEALRNIGLSNAKVSYVRNVAQFAIEKGVDAKHLHKMNNEEVILYLTQIKGVGQWTAEMLLMFTLGREDVFAADDLGIQVSMQKIYNLNSSDKKKLKEQMLLISENWKPYRTYACLHLWHFKDSR